MCLCVLSRNVNFSIRLSLARSTVCGRERLPRPLILGCKAKIHLSLPEDGTQRGMERDCHVKSLLEYTFLHMCGWHEWRRGRSLLFPMYYCSTGMNVIKWDPLLVIFCKFATTLSLYLRQQVLFVQSTVYFCKPDLQQIRPFQYILYQYYIPSYFAKTNTHQILGQTSRSKAHFCTTL